VCCGGADTSADLLDSFGQQSRGNRSMRGTEGVSRSQYGSIGVEGRQQPAGRGGVQSPLRSSIDSSTYELLPRKRSGELEDDDFEMI
jgi:hypothetical protein